MDQKKLLELLKQIQSNQRSPEDVCSELKNSLMIDLDFAKLDLHRPLRNDLSEVIYGAGKSNEQIIKIVEALNSINKNILGTHIKPEIGEILSQKYSASSYDLASKTFSLVTTPCEPINKKLAIICAGTSDIPIAEEARLTAKFFGIEANTFYDVGVAGIHRVFNCIEDIKSCDVSIIVAGMEGALPSVMGGLTPMPIIAVPTSIGYGTNLSGFTPLFAMLNSCSEGITVVNINNGFGAACAALRILKNK